MGNTMKSIRKDFMPTSGEIYTNEGGLVIGQIAV